jgi:hypothetical protein
MKPIRSGTSDVPSENGLTIRGTMATFLAIANILYFPNCSLIAKKLTVPLTIGPKAVDNALYCKELE